jgi:hypothetical protein
MARDALRMPGDISTEYTVPSIPYTIPLIDGRENGV